MRFFMSIYSIYSLLSFTLDIHFTEGVWYLVYKCIRILEYEMRWFLWVTASGPDLVGLIVLVASETRAELEGSCLLNDWWKHDRWISQSRRDLSGLSFLQLKTPVMQRIKHLWLDYFSHKCWQMRVIFYSLRIEFEWRRTSGYQARIRIIWIKKAAKWSPDTQVVPRASPISRVVAAASSEV